MENINDESGHSQPQDTSVKTESKTILTTKTAIIVTAIIILAAVAYYYKSVFVAAMVDGSPISRLAVIRELEKEGGKKVLDTIITEKLIRDEATKKNISVSRDEIASTIKDIEGQLARQQRQLADVLTAEGMTMTDLEQRLTVQKLAEKLVDDKTQVSDAEIDQFIQQNKITIPQGQEASSREQIKNQITQQKLATESNALVDQLRTQAKIQYWKNY